MSTSQFHHTVFAAGQPRTNNTLGSLFVHDPWIHLVSEGAQNTQDGTRRVPGAGMARLTFRFATLPRRCLDTYGLSDVMAHVGACTERDLGSDVGSTGVRVLFMEDRGCGLEGAYLDEGDGTQASPAQRYLYVVGSGIQGKSGADNGRHGLGSSVGPFSSKIRCMFFHTTRLDGTTFASGRLSLPTRSFDGRHYGPESRFGIVRDGAWVGPLHGSAADDFAHAVGIARPVDQSGLSCVIVDPVDGMTPNALAAATLAGQFYQIDSGAIEIEIIDEDAGFNLLINADTIDSIIGSPLMEELIAVGGRKRDYRVLSDLPGVLSFIRSYRNAGELDTVEEDDLGKAAAGMRLSWLSGKPCGIRIPISVSHVDRGAVSGTIGAWIKPSASLSSGYDILVRDSIVIVSPTSGRLSLAASKDDGISEFLGDCEDPSHRAFREQLGKQRGWATPRTVLSTFKNMGRNLHSAMANSVEEADRQSLARFFPSPGRDVSSDIAGGPEEENGENGAILMAESLFGLVEKVNRKSGAVVISLSRKACEACESGESFDFSITADYEGSRRGVGGFADSGAFFAVERGASEHLISGNTLYVYGATEELRISISNVDRNRDLKIAYSQIDAAADGQEAA